MGRGCREAQRPQQSQDSLAEKGTSVRQEHSRQGTALAKALMWAGLCLHGHGRAGKPSEEDENKECGESGRCWAPSQAWEAATAFTLRNQEPTGLWETLPSLPLAAGRLLLWQRPVGRHLQEPSKTPRGFDQPGCTRLWNGLIASVCVRP